MAEWRPNAGLEALAARARLLRSIRAFFEERGVMEVETPIAVHAAVTDPGIAQTGLAGRSAAWLRTSPEFAMKRLLAAGAGDIYEIGRAFRGGEAGRCHNPEFTLLEWYRLGWDHLRLGQEAVDLINHCGSSFGRHWKADVVTYRLLFTELVGTDGLTAGTAELTAAAARLGIRLTTGPALDHSGLLDLLFSHAVQPGLPPDRITVITGFPACQAALARIREGEPPVAERFELFLGSLELANGYHELADAEEQRARFEEDNRRRAAAGIPLAAPDQRLLDALASGFPECAGVALGVDRLLMACMGADHIDAVLAFNDDRA